jgi:hypothetical protein
VYFIELETPNPYNNHKFKTWLISRINQHRLTGLALLHVHTNIIVFIDETINKFAKMKKRNLEFVI